jgi:hypothetical protein
MGTERPVRRVGADACAASRLATSDQSDPSIKNGWMKRTGGAAESAGPATRKSTTPCGRSIDVNVRLPNLCESRPTYAVCCRSKSSTLIECRTSSEAVVFTAFDWQSVDLAAVFASGECCDFQLSFVDQPFAPLAMDASR